MIIEFNQQDFDNVKFDKEYDNKVRIELSDNYLLYEDDSLFTRIHKEKISLSVPKSLKEAFFEKIIIEKSDIKRLEIGKHSCDGGDSLKYYFVKVFSYPNLGVEHELVIPTSTIEQSKDVFTQIQNWKYNA